MVHPGAVVLLSSSKRMISKPSFWKSALFTSGSMLVWSHKSAWASVPSCALSMTFGTMKEYWGKVPFVKSLAKLLVKSTMLFLCIELLATSVRKSNELWCLR